MNLPIDYSKVEEFVKEHNLFEYTKELMIKALKAWYEEDASAFEEYFHCELNKVLSSYKFSDYTVSFSTRYHAGPQVNYISIYIEIYDANDSYVAYYQAVFDKSLNMIDEKLNK